MKILVGMPAYKLPDVVNEVLHSMTGTPAQALVVDNASNEDVKRVLRSYDVPVITNTENLGCNGAWNQILGYGLRNGFDVIGLNTDAALKPGWYESLVDWINSNPKTCVVTNVGKPETPTHLFEVSGSPLTFLPREAAEIVYPIPQKLVHWFGDTYMFVKLRRLGWKMMVVGHIRADHRWSRITEVSPEVSPVIPQDKIEWKKLYPEITFE